MATEVRAPFPFFTDLDGNPLEDGYIYIGIQNLNPLGNPKQAYWDYALTVPAYNVRTSVGFPVYNGSPARLYVDGSFSIQVKDKNSVTVYTALSVEGVPSILNEIAQNQIEYSHFIGEVFPLLDVRAPAVWNAATPRTYFPALCLTNFDKYVDISSANWGADAINYLRDLKITYKDGLTGVLTSFGVTNWAIAANVATLTFTNNADHIAALNALLEDEVAYAAYLRTTTLDTAIGDIPSGTYALTNINAGARTVSFALTAANNSGAGAFTVSFYANRIAGSTTTARVFSARGRAIHGAGDDNGYMVNGLARRGFGQGHWHQADGINGLIGSGAASFTPGTQIPTEIIAKTIITDGTNGTPRIAKDTNSPAFSMPLYLFLGSYV